MTILRLNKMDNKRKLATKEMLSKIVLILVIFVAIVSLALQPVQVFAIQYDVPIPKDNSLNSLKMFVNGNSTLDFSVHDFALVTESLRINATDAKLHIKTIVVGDLNVNTSSSAPALKGNMKYDIVFSVDFKGIRMQWSSINFTNSLALSSLNMAGVAKVDFNADTFSLNLRGTIPVWKALQLYLGGN